jgi:nuclear pore complex protein Nup205
VSGLGNGLISDPISLADGRSIRVTDQLLNTTNAVSESLSLSQVLSAVIATQAILQRPRYPNRGDAEIAAYILHEANKFTLDFLLQVLHITLGPEEDRPEFEELREWVEGLLVTKTSLGEGKGDGALVDRVMIQLDEIQGKLDSLVRLGRNDLVTYRVESLRSEQNKLARILCLVAESGALRKSQVLRIARWLKKCDRIDGIVGTVLR